MKELDQTLEKYNNKKKLILFGDFNEQLSEKGNYSIGTVSQQRGLTSVLHGIANIQPSTTKSKRIIDHIFVKGIELHNLYSRGQLPMGTIFYRSDHCGIYVDVGKEEFDLEMDEPVTRSSRRLVLNNLKTETEYISELTRMLGDHNVLQRLERLKQNTQSGVITDQQRKEWNSLDDIITSSMLASEASLPDKKYIYWTSGLKTLATGI